MDNSTAAYSRYTDHDVCETVPTPYRFPDLNESIEDTADEFEDVRCVNPHCPLQGTVFSLPSIEELLDI